MILFTFQKMHCFSIYDHFKTSYLFDGCSHMSSTMYFFLLALNYVLHKPDAYFYIARIVLLILPVLFFGKMGIMSYKYTCNKNVFCNVMFQKLSLFVYFVFTVLSLVLTHGGQKNDPLWLTKSKFGVLCILIPTSCIAVFMMLSKLSSYQNNVEFIILTVTCFFLTCTYALNETQPILRWFYGTDPTIINKDKNSVIIKDITIGLSFALSGLFAFLALLSFQKADHGRFQHL